MFKFTAGLSSSGSNYWKDIEWTLGHGQTSTLFSDPVMNFWNYICIIDSPNLFKHHSITSRCHLSQYDSKSYEEQKRVTLVQRLSVALFKKIKDRCEICEWIVIFTDLLGTKQASFCQEEMKSFQFDLVFWASLRLRIGNGNKMWAFTLLTTLNAKFFLLALLKECGLIISHSRSKTIRTALEKMDLIASLIRPGHVYSFLHSSCDWIRQDSYQQ